MFHKCNPVLLLTLISISLTSARANIIANIRFDTGALIGHPVGPFALELQFNDGSGVGEGNNSVLLNNFVFGGGSPIGLPSAIGGATGNLGSSIMITDTSFLNRFVQNIAPGTQFGFQINLSTNVDLGGIPDEFSLSILDNSGFEIPTFGPANALLLIDIDSATPTILSFGTDTSQNPGAGGPPINIAPPQVSAATVPEPSTCLLLGLCILFGMRGLALRHSREMTRLARDTEPTTTPKRWRSVMQSNRSF